MPRAKPKPGAAQTPPGAKHGAATRCDATSTDPLSPAIRDWFHSHGWTPYEFQESAWRAHAAGHSGLVHVPTGAGKTYAATLAALSECLEDPGVGPGRKVGESIRLLYISPLRAVSRDIAKAIARPIDDLDAHDLVTIETRTGDTSSSVRAKQKSRLPTVLVTTPESLTLLLSQPECEQRFRTLRTVVVDEWHELLSTKRGTQTELALARLRTIAPDVRTWALSATLGNIRDAAQAAVGVDVEPEIVTAPIDREILIDSVLPKPGDRFPWAGHLGLTMLPRVVESIETDHEGLPAVSTLVFTNTRSQSERWYSALLAAKPEWEGVVALHHGSIDRDERERVEAGLKDGSVRLVVATSSLDLGVDFAPVERVMQIGSPKGVARLVQRAGRASHRPGAACRITCVPTHALEMVEIAAVRRAIAAGHMEDRRIEPKPIDVLSQHLVTRALGGGFTREQLLAEVRTAWSYRDLTDEEFGWALALVEHGGDTLKAYPDHHRVEPDDAGVYRVTKRRLAQLHRMNIGTITGDGTVDIRFQNGRRLGSIEENFVANLRAGQKFVFAGRVLEFIRLHQMTAHVRPARGKTNHTPIWSGTRLPITEALGSAVRETLGEAAHKRAHDPELLTARPLIEIQSRLSTVPKADETLVEIAATREGAHLFVYPFGGRLVHAGIAAILALRLSRSKPATFSIAANDYGFELLTDKSFDFARTDWPEVFGADCLAEDAVESVNLSTLAKRQFREVARVAGLVFQSHPGNRRSVKHLQSQAGLIYEVFEQFDPENKLLLQARREVLDKHFERSRLGRTMARLAAGPLRVVEVARPTPMSLPLIVERVGGTLSSESLADRIERMQAAWERA